MGCVNRGLGGFQPRLGSGARAVTWLRPDRRPDHGSGGRQRSSWVPVGRGQEHGEACRPCSHPMVSLRRAGSTSLPLARTRPSAGRHPSAARSREPMPRIACRRVAHPREPRVAQRRIRLRSACLVRSESRPGDDMSLVTAVHESLFTWDGNAVWAAARPFPAQQQVEDHGPPSWASVVLNQAELVVLGIGHNDDGPFVVLVPLAGEASAQRSDDVDCLADVIDRNVQMDTDFACLRLGDRLEYQPRLGVVTLAEVTQPAWEGPGSRPSRALQNRATRCGSRQSIVTPDQTFTTVTFLWLKARRLTSPAPSARGSPTAGNPIST